MVGRETGEDGVAREPAEEDGALVEPLDVGAGAPVWAPPEKRRLTRRAKGLRVGSIVALVVVTLFLLLDGPALVMSGWQRLDFALHSGARAPRLAMTAWQGPFAAPNPLDGTLTYTSDPAQSGTVYGCVAHPSGVSVFMSSSGGRAWDEVFNVPSFGETLSARSCKVKVAADSSTDALVVVHARDRSNAGCDRLILYSRTTGADTVWTPVTPPTIARACLEDAWVSAHALYYWWTDSGGAMATTGIERSSDQGRTWTSLAVGNGSGSYSLVPALPDAALGDTLTTQVYYWPTTTRQPQVEIWRSRDSGASWRRALNAPLGARLFTGADAGAAGAGWPAIYEATYAGGELSPPWIPNEVPAALKELQPNGTTWRTLPPLPLAGAQAESGPKAMGVTTPLAVATGGRLLALGQNPQATPTLKPQGDLWVWAWDPAAREWRVGGKAPASATLAGLAHGMGPVGSAYAGQPGIFLWMTGEEPNGQTGLYRAFIPDAQR